MHDLSWLSAHQPELNFDKLAQSLATLNAQNPDAVMAGLLKGWADFQQSLIKPFKKTITPDKFQQCIGDDNEAVSVSCLSATPSVFIENFMKHLALVAINSQRLARISFVIADRPNLPLQLMNYWAQQFSQQPDFAAQQRWIQSLAQSLGYDDYRHNPYTWIQKFILAGPIAESTHSQSSQTDTIATDLESTLFDPNHDFYADIVQQTQRWQALSQEAIAVANQALERSCITTTQVVSPWPQEHSELGYADVVQNLRQAMAEAMPQIGYLTPLLKDAEPQTEPQQQPRLDLALMSKIRDSFFSVAPRDHHKVFKPVTSCSQPDSAIATCDHKALYVALSRHDFAEAGLFIKTLMNLWADKHWLQMQAWLTWINQTGHHFSPQQGKIQVLHHRINPPMLDFCKKNGFDMREMQTSSNHFLLQRPLVETWSQGVFMLPNDFREILLDLKALGLGEKDLSSTFYKITAQIPLASLHYNFTDEVKSYYENWINLFSQDPSKKIDTQFKQTYASVMIDTTLELFEKIPKILVKLKKLCVSIEVLSHCLEVSRSQTSSVQQSKQDTVKLFGCEGLGITAWIGANDLSKKHSLFSSSTAVPALHTPTGGLQP